MDKDIAIVSQGKNKWTISYNSRHFIVNDLTKEIIKSLSEESSNDKVKSYINYLGYSNIEDQLINELREKVFKTKPNKKGQPIKGKVSIINLDKCKVFLKQMGFLFHPIVSSFFVLCWIFLLSYQHQEIFNVSRNAFLTELSNKPYLFVIYAIISLLLIIIHEFGHAVSAFKFNVAPKEIGFGFYLYFPVFFTDVSSSWMASKWQRIVIDVAGFYFQVIAMTILLIFSLILPISSTLLQVVILDNILIILYNLNPLFRFDGYWIFSDFFEIPNLRKKADEAISEIIFRLFNFRSSKTTPLRFRNSIYIYSVISHFFILSMVMLFYIYTIKTIHWGLTNGVNTTYVWNDILIWFLKLGFLLTGCFFTSKSLIIITQNIFRNAIRLHKQNKVYSAKSRKNNE